MESHLTHLHHNIMFVELDLSQLKFIMMSSPLFFQSGWENRSGLGKCSFVSRSVNQSPKISGGFIPRFCVTRAISGTYVLNNAAISSPGQQRIIIHLTIWFAFFFGADASLSHKKTFLQFFP